MSYHCNTCGKEHVTGEVCPNPVVEKRSGTKFVTAIPSESGRCVGMTTYKGNIIIACEFHIYELSQKKIFKKIKFEVVDKNKLTK